MEKTEAMTPTERERIEDEAEKYASYNYGSAERGVARQSYTIGAKSEYERFSKQLDKARNQAIDDAIKKLNESFAFGSINLERNDWDEINNILESLKTKP